ncbi:hypothetical protein EPN87_02870 [archaeon]|nr:MAG: hypothetical protein EPN87_02870 [archaeon]
MKGQMQTLESVIAVVIIAGTFIFLYSGQYQIPNLESVNRKLVGFNALQSLDSSNQLRQYVVANDSRSIENLLASFLTNVNYNVSICYLTCPETSFVANNTAAVTYLVAGNASAYYPEQVVLYQWTQ